MPLHVCLERERQYSCDQIDGRILIQRRSCSSTGVDRFVSIMTQANIVLAKVGELCLHGCCANICAVEFHNRARRLACDCDDALKTSRLHHAYRNAAQRTKYLVGCAVYHFVSPRVWLARVRGLTTSARGGVICVGAGCAGAAPLDCAG